MAFSNTIDENVWADLMSKTSAGQAKAGAIQQMGVQTKPKKVKNFKQKDRSIKTSMTAIWFVRSLKRHIRDAVKDLIDFWQHKTGKLQIAPCFGQVRLPKEMSCIEHLKRKTIRRPSIMRVERCLGKPRKS